MEKEKQTDSKPVLCAVKFRKMEFIGIHIAYEPNAWFWITLLNFDWKDQSRSLLHIEKNNSVWKFQFLWLNNQCWCVG